MTLLAEIVTLLSDENGSLNQALLKTKVLLHKIGEQELAAWVSEELNGYPADKEPPPYRVVHARVLANISNGHWRYPSHQVPIGHLDKNKQEMLEKEKLRESIAVLEQWASMTDGHLQHPLAPEFHGALGKSLAGGFWIERAWTEIQASQVVQVLTQIRSRLLDFILNLQSGVGEELPDTELKAKAESLDTKSMFASSIFGGQATFGDNTTIVLGHGNVTTITSTVQKGDFEALAALLRQNKVSEPDVQALEAAVEADKDAPELAQKQFGSNVKSWMKNMLSKAVETSWHLEVGIAAGLLTNALQSYYFGG